MPHYFTHYWRNGTVHAQVSVEEEKPLDYAADNFFAQRGVAPGDQVYVVTMAQGQLSVVGKMIVGQLVHDPVKAAALLGCSPYYLWEARDHLIAAQATTMATTHRLSTEDTERLRFISNGELRPPVFKAPGYLDQQTLRGVRRLAEASAAILDAYLPSVRPTVIPGGDGAKPTADPLELEQRTRQLLKLEVLPRPAGQRVPQRSPVTTQTVFARDPQVRAWVLRQAHGVCERCEQPAPFMTVAGLPYLEVHHVRPLSEGGSDTVENAVALCPNCHRLMHLSIDAEMERPRLYQQVSRLVEE